MKKYIFWAVVFIFGAAPAWARDPDVEGRVTRLDYTQGRLLVLNELNNDIGKREYRVTVKPGMINEYKKNDRLKVWLPDDRKEASMIERISR